MNRCCLLSYYLCYVQKKKIKKDTGLFAGMVLEFTKVGSKDMFGIVESRN